MRTTYTETKRNPFLILLVFVSGDVLLSLSLFLPPRSLFVFISVSKRIIRYYVERDRDNVNGQWTFNNFLYTHGRFKLDTSFLRKCVCARTHLRPYRFSKKVYIYVLVGTCYRLRQANLKNSYHGFKTPSWNNLKLVLLSNQIIIHPYSPLITLHNGIMR